MPTPPEIRQAADEIVKAAVEGWLVGSPNSEFRRIVEAVLEGMYRAGQEKNRWPCHRTREEYTEESVFLPCNHQGAYVDTSGWHCPKCGMTKFHEDMREGAISIQGSGVVKTDTSGDI